MRTLRNNTKIHTNENMLLKIFAIVRPVRVLIVYVKTSKTIVQGIEFVVPVSVVKL